MLMTQAKHPPPQSMINVAIVAKLCSSIVTRSTWTALPTLYTAKKCHINKHNNPPLQKHMLNHGLIPLCFCIPFLSPPCPCAHTARPPARSPGSVSHPTLALSGWTQGSRLSRAPATKWNNESRICVYQFFLTMSSGPSQECLKGRSSGTILLSIISMSSRTSGSQFSLMAREADV